MKISTPTRSAQPRPGFVQPVIAYARARQQPQETGTTDNEKETSLCQTMCTACRRPTSVWPWQGGPSSQSTTVAAGHKKVPGANRFGLGRFPAAPRQLGWVHGLENPDLSII